MQTLQHNATAHHPEVIQARPEVAMVHRSAQLSRMFAEQFGLTPSARTRLGKDEGDLVDMEGILS